MKDFLRKAEDMVFALWKANAQTHNDRIAIVIAVLKQSYRAGVKALESDLITLCQNGGQSWAWIEEATTRLLRAHNDKLGNGE